MCFLSALQQRLWTLTTPFSHMTDILSSTPLTPLGIFLKSSFPRAFWSALKVQLSVPVTCKSLLQQIHRTHYGWGHELVLRIMQSSSQHPQYNAVKMAALFPLKGEIWFATKLSSLVTAGHSPWARTAHPWGTQWTLCIVSPTFQGQYFARWLKASYSLCQQIHEIVWCRGITAQRRAHHMTSRMTPALVEHVSAVRAQASSNGLSKDHLTWY